MTTFEKLKDILVNEQDHRPHRQDWVADNMDHEHPTLRWVIAEREAMFNSVNDLRKAAGKEPVTMRDVYVKELLAEGHVDYTRKFAFGCAELVEK